MVASTKEAQRDERVMLKCGCAAHARKKVGEQWVPACIVHDCTEQVEAPSLQGRMASCASNCGNQRPSSLDLAFFEYRGPGAPRASELCKCGYYEVAHIEHPDRLKCKQFVPHGPWETDSFYCGCRGWD